MFFYREIFDEEKELEGMVIIGDFVFFNIIEV